jgi:hypothetical protein
VTELILYNPVLNQANTISRATNLCEDNPEETVDYNLYAGCLGPVNPEKKTEVLHEC